MITTGAKPWNAEGVSRATWYRRRYREGEIETASCASHVPAPGETAQTETETAGETAETASGAAAVPDVAPVSADGETVTAHSPEAEPWALSAADLARHAERFRAARNAKGEMIAARALKWQLQDTGTPYQFLQREVDRVRELATQISQ